MIWNSHHLLKETPCENFVRNFVCAMCFVFLRVCPRACASVPMPICRGLFGSAKCPHAHIQGPFWQCKVSPCPFICSRVPCQTIRFMIISVP